MLEMKYKRILAVVLSAMAIVLSGIAISPLEKEISLGQEVQAAVITAFEQHWNFQPYTTNQTSIVSNVNGILKLQSTNNDPWLQMYNIGSFNPNTYRYIEIKYRVNEGVAPGYQIYYLTNTEPNASEDKALWSGLIADGQWHTQRLDMWDSPKYKNTGNITGWRYDWATESGCTIEFDYIKLIESNLLTLSPRNPIPNQLFYTSFVPSMKVLHKENSTLTCQYYIDSETTPRETKTVSNTTAEQTVNFNTFDVRNLSDGTHTIKYEMTDGYITKPVIQTVTFRVDKTTPTADKWTQRASAPITSCHDKAVAINGKMYVFGGGLYEYDPNEDMWFQKASGPHYRDWHSAAVMNGKMYICGGYYYDSESSSYKYLNDLWEYNPATNTWVPKADSPYSFKGCPAVAVNGAMYVFGIEDNILVYHLAADTWTEIPTTKSFGAKSAVEIGGKIYIQYDGSRDHIWEYDPMTNVWTQKKNCYGMSDHSAVAVDGRLYAHGGRTSCLEYTQWWTWEYNPETDTWTQKTGGEFPREYHSAVAINGKMYIFGGYNSSSSYRNDLWEYDCNITPKISTTIPTANQRCTSFYPSISVSDFDNDTLTCKYYIDSETSPRETKTVMDAMTGQTVTFSNVLTLDDGIHNIRYEINDGYLPVTQTVTFIVDSTPPTVDAPTLIADSSSQITVQPNAYDPTVNGVTTGLHPIPYGYYTADSIIITPWQAGNYIASGLAPNTEYTYKYLARDAINNVSEYSTTVSKFTLANMPELSVSNPTSYTLDVSTTDNNPDYTYYQISVSNNNETKYVTQEGNLTATPVWIKLTSKVIKVKGLNPDTVYTFSAKARNDVDNIETTVCALVSGTTLVAPVAPPANIIATATDNTIKLAWDAVSGAISYDVVEVKVANEITENDIVNVTTNEYTQAGFYPGTPHTFLIRSRNEGDPGIWSSKITKSTLPSDPSVPANLNAVPLTTSITVVWNNVPGATGYDIQYDWDNENDEKNIVSIGPNTSYIHSSLTPGKSHIYRVRSINAGGKSEWSSLIEASTLVEAVPVPVNIKTEPTKNSIIVTWDAVEGATGYTIEADGEKYDISKNTYIHSNLASDTKPHVYSIRANRNGRTSDWSSAIIAYTLVDKFGTPVNFKASSDDSSVSLSWDSVKDAISYVIQRNDVTIDNITETSCVDNGLLQNETYTYRVRAISETGFSAFTSPIEIKLKELSTPKNLEATSDENSIFISWEPVNGATTYDVEFDDLTETVSTTTYSAINLISGSQHKIRVMARNEDGGTSSWSTPLLKSTVFAMDNVPNVSAITKKSSVTVLWNSMIGATGYDVEVNGNVISNVTGSAITFRDLPAETQYEYRVRALNSTGAGNWSNMLTVFTLPQGPSAPSNVKASATMTSILVTWEKVAGATEYELSITDLKTNEESRIQVGSGNSYLHNGLAPDRTFIYKVKAKNISEESNWSTETTMSTLSSEQTFNISSATGEVFDLVLSASNIQDIGSYTFRVQYNIEDYEVIDLCGLTAKLDTQAGDIAGTDISVTYVAPGTIVFVKTGSVNSWQVWSGIVNTIKLKAKHDGEATITYSMQ